ncbi:protein BCCIP homolog [Cylas formicarius]|uniref:protein BCCIP homolog n=1 Tax=Cylas formicarius TaxID=197179 RepID=UPI002958A600|nr:protein BCCIP homolog [Cylas formicarius]
MAGPTKKPKKPSAPESDNESMSEESESGTYHGQQEVQATFEGRNPEGQDFHGIKQLLQQLFLKAHIDLSEMSDMLISQSGLGSVLKQSANDSDDEDDMELSEECDVFGITSLINLTVHKDKECVKQFYNLLEEFSLKHSGKEIQETVKTILNQSLKVCFLINERFVNIPAKISAVMLSSLYNELQRITKKDPSYNFQYFVMICKTCRPKGDKEGEEIYSNDEEQIFTKSAEITFDFSVETESDIGLGGRWLSEDKQMVPYRRVVIFKGDKLKSIINEITVLVQ